MSRFANYNGEIVSAGEGFLPPDNRAFRYGDGLFESIRISDGYPLFVETHFARLREGMEALGITVPPEYNARFFYEQIRELAKKNEITGGGRVRLTIYRSAGGLYQPSDNSPGYVIEMSALVNNHFELNDDGLSVDLYPDIKKPVNKLSIYKTCNSLLYILGSSWAVKNKLDDALIVNDKGNIIEATSTNLFIVCNGVLYTPALTDGCVAGVMRMQIINLAIENKIKVYECSLTPQNLLVADEVFLTSAVRGLQWVGSYRMKRYYNTLTRVLLDKLNEKAHAALNAE